MNILKRLFDTPKGNIITSLVIILSYLLSCIVYNVFNLTLTIFRPCRILTETGIKCPGCGGTRAAQQILSFNFYEAFRYHPFFTVFVVSVLFLTVYIFINAFRRPYKPLTGRINIKLWQGIVVGIFSFILIFGRLLPPFNYFFY